MGFVSFQRASRDLKPLITTIPSKKNMSLRQSLISSLSLVAVFAAAAVASAEETLPTPRSIILAAGQEAAPCQPHGASYSRPDRKRLRNQ